MNLKLRFAFLFTILVAIILSFSMAAIYLLYYDYRKADFYRRLVQQAQQAFQLHHNSKISDSFSYTLSVQSGRQLYEEQDFIVDSSFQVKYQFPDTSKFFLTKEDLLPSKKKIERLNIKNKEGVAIYYPRENVYAVSIAYDRVGVRKAENLRNILIIVTLVAVSVTAFVSFLYARQITRPLSKLSEEIGSISESNLTQRVRVSRGNDELSQIARNFNEMLNRLEKAFNIQKSFVHHASHELRTPLASMLSQTELALRQTLEPEQYKKVLESLKEDQQGLIDLTNSLLSLSQFEKIAAHSSWPSVRIDELLFDTVEASKKLFSDIYITLNFVEIPENEDYLIVKGNDTLLKSAFINLIKNGYRYSNNKKVDIFLKATSDSIVVTVENTGRQIPEEERSRLFIPFFRGRNAVGLKGFGLGLSIVNRIIHLHIGTVHYEAQGEDLNRFVVEFIK